mmetsp:Transcript_33865/g.80453  ORF Transcript_33865/g.80453 Transcript_33865/m.80453 type:complete len:232 (-) Transcript_33865:99-794(-)
MMAFIMTCGYEACVWKPVAKQTAATLPVAAMNLPMSVSSLILITEGSNTPPSHTKLTVRPYLNGLMPILVRRAASEVPTLTPSNSTLQSLIISIEPLLILVAMFRAWKKEVWAGSSPVAPFGTMHSQGAMTPALAAAGLTYSSTTVCSSPRSPLVNMKPRLPFITGTIAAHSGWLPSEVRSRMQRRTMVFLPNTSSALPRRAIRMSEICFDPTKSACTMNARWYLLRHSVR